MRKPASSMSLMLFRGCPELPTQRKGPTGLLQQGLSCPCRKIRRAIAHPTVARLCPYAASFKTVPALLDERATKVARIATGEEQEEFPANDGKDKAAQSLGRRGGKVRAEALREAVLARWRPK
jgi:hypothetical protein